MILHGQDPDPDIRATAIQALSSWNTDERGKDVIDAALRDDDRYVRMYGLHAGKGEIEFERLVKALQDSDPQVRITAIQILVEYHRDALKTVDLLIERLRDPSSKVIIEAMNGLVQLKAQMAVQPLINLRNRKKIGGVENAIKEITGKTIEDIQKNDQLVPNEKDFGEAPVRPIDSEKIIKRFKDGRRHERVTAIRDLALVSDLEAQKFLLKGLTNEDPHVRYTSIESLLSHIVPLNSTQDLDSIFKGIMNSMNDPDPHVKRLAVGTISIFTLINTYRPRVIELLKDIVERERDPFVLMAALTFIGSTRQLEAGPILMKFIKDSIPEVRKNAIYGIHPSCLPEAIGPMLDALSDPVFRVRLHALQNLPAIGELKEEEVRKLRATLLESSRKDPSPMFREKARQYLESIQEQDFSSQKKDFAKRKGKGAKSTNCVL